MVIAGSVFSSRIFEGDNIRTFVGDKGGIKDCISTINYYTKTHNEEEGRGTFDEIVIHGEIDGCGILFFFVFRIMVHSNRIADIGRWPSWCGGVLRIHSATGRKADTGSFGEDDDGFIGPDLFRGVDGYLMRGFRMMLLLLLTERRSRHFGDYLFRPGLGSVGGGDGGDCFDLLIGLVK